MERGEVRMMPALPEELVERILGLVPFPYIFKARAISKSWLARLSPVSFARHDEEKRLAISFQRRMAQDWSTKWPTFCPIVIRNEDLIAYDRASRQWQGLPSLPDFKPKNLGISSRHMQGALYFNSFNDKRVLSDGWRSEEIYVANVLTQSWKRLPPCPHHLLRQGFCHARTAVTQAETYKVIEIYELLHHLGLYLLIYNSKENAWKGKMVDVPAGFKVYREGAHFNGAVYWLVGPRGMPEALLAFNIEEETLQILQLPAFDEFDQPAKHSWDSLDLVVCDSSLVLVVTYEDDTSAMQPERMIVIKIDLESQMWLEVTRSPRSDDWECVFVSSDCLYIVGTNFTQTLTEFEVLESGYEYNFKTDKWSTFPLLGNKCDRNKFCFFSFQPGLNPFLEL